MADELKIDVNKSKKDLDSILETVQNVRTGLSQAGKEAEGFGKSVKGAQKAADVTGRAMERSNKSTKEMSDSQKETTKNMKEFDMLTHRINRSLGDTRTIMDDIADFSETWGSSSGFPTLTKALSGGIGKLQNKDSIIGKVGSAFVSMSKGMQFMGQTSKLLGSVFRPLLSMVSLAGGLLKGLFFILVGTHEKAAQNAGAFQKMALSMGTFGENIDRLDKTNLTALQVAVNKAGKELGFVGSEMIEAFGALAESGGVFDLTEKGVDRLSRSIRHLAVVTGQDFKQVASQLGKLISMTGRGEEYSSAVLSTVKDNFINSGMEVGQFTSTVMEAVDSMGDFGTMIKGNARYLASLKNVTHSNTRALEAFRSAQEGRKREIGESSALLTDFLGSKEGKRVIGTMILDVQKKLDDSKKEGGKPLSKEESVIATTQLRSFKKLLKSPSDIGAINIFRKGVDAQVLASAEMAGLLRLMVGNTENFDINKFLDRGDFNITQFAEGFKIREESFRVFINSFAKAQKKDPSMGLNEFIGQYMTKSVAQSEEDKVKKEAAEKAAADKWAKEQLTIAKQAAAFTESLTTHVADIFPEIGKMGGLADMGLGGLEKAAVWILHGIRSVVDMIKNVWMEISNLTATIASSWFFKSPPLPVTPASAPPTLTVANLTEGLYEDMVRGHNKHLDNLYKPGRGGNTTLNLHSNLSKFSQVVSYAVEQGR